MATSPDVDHGLRNFAVLHHTGVDEPHFDFMFDTSDDSDLITFRLPQWPIFETQPATKLRNHRRFYLKHTGPVPGDRGTVNRVDEGQLHVIKTPTGWELQHPDGRMFARFEPQSVETEPEWTAMV